MKFFGPNSISHYLYYIARMAAIGSILLLLFIGISILVGNFEVVNGRFQIALPFFPETFIKGFYTKSVITSILIILLYMVFFFYALSQVFSSFKSETLFTNTAIQRLRFFALLNLVVFPILYGILHLLILKKSGISSIHNVFLSFVLGTFLVFVAAIFKRGVHVQHENDLTI